LTVAASAVTLASLLSGGAFHAATHFVRVRVETAEIRVSTNGRKTFYNQVLAAYTGWVDRRNLYGQAVRFSDGSEIPAAFIE
jgi:hypothetical protein